MPRHLALIVLEHPDLGGVLDVREAASHYQRLAAAQALRQGHLGRGAGADVVAAAAGAASSGAGGAGEQAGGAGGPVRVVREDALAGAVRVFDARR